ncbi:flagellar basal body P-ring formation chaperone FlgA [Catenovulum sediminis]|uniref:flagellar basal body P-ring formation chaperone FlgA n=1 Tax=Catenovulum sediminis TaxID=1740262 RepID=UPI00117C82D3|nr:flagellar basal body P-ring formation chaperone FlgA [Catenovulum sediminis]
MLLSSLLSLALGTEFNCGPTNSEPLTGSTKIEWQAKVCKHFAYLGEEVSIAVISQPITVNKPNSSNHSKFELGALISGRSKFSWQDQEGKLTQAWLKIKVLKEVWVFEQDLPQLSMLTEEVVKLKKLDVAALLPEPLILTNTLSELVTRKNVRKGQILTQATVAVSPKIFPRQQITIVLKNRGLTLETLGTSIDAGWEIGDSVRALITDSNKSISGLVAAEGIIYVH